VLIVAGVEDRAAGGEAIERRQGQEQVAVSINPGISR